MAGSRRRVPGLAAQPDPVTLLLRRASIPADLCGLLAWRGDSRDWPSGQDDGELLAGLAVAGVQDHVQGIGVDADRAGDLAAVRQTPPSSRGRPPEPMLMHCTGRGVTRRRCTIANPVMTAADASVEGSCRLVFHQLSTACDQASPAWRPRRCWGAALQTTAGARWPGLGQRDGRLQAQFDSERPHARRA